MLGGQLRELIDEALDAQTHWPALAQDRRRAHERIERLRIARLPR
jgi:hypothetical protein